MQDFNLFIPLQKQNEDQRVVSGYASTEVVDSQGEIVERSAIEEALPGYLGSFDAQKGRFQYGNIREMHQASAVGKTMAAHMDDTGLFIDAKVVDENAWTKVKEGVYAGFSIGGRVVERDGNRIKRLKLSEISLVDRPANPKSTFTMVKFDQGNMQKNEDMEYEEPAHSDVIHAGAILEVAAELRAMMMFFEWQGKSTTELDSAIKNLKKLAVKILTESEMDKFNKIFSETVSTELGILSQQVSKYTPEETMNKAQMSQIYTYDLNGYFGNQRKALG